MTRFGDDRSPKRSDPQGSDPQGSDPQGSDPQDEQLHGGDGLGEPLDEVEGINALGSEPDDGAALLPLLDAEAGPARPLAERELLLLADRIERQFAQRKPPVSRWSPRRLVLAGGLFAASAAAAVMGVKVVQLIAESGRAAQPAEPRPVATPAPRLPGAAEPNGVAPPVLPVPPASVPAPEVQERPAESAAVQLPEAGATSAPSSPEAKPGARSSRAGAAARAGAHQGGTVTADRLAAANSLRSRHRYREALALYLQVIEMDPDGMQASVARVAAAEMQLGQLGDIAGAERLYREARTQGGELTAEAQFGLSQVARARADTPAELRALQDFLSRHPSSPLAAAARRRLTALGDR